MVINEKVIVGMVNDSPRYVLWKGKNYKILKIGLHHHFRKGSTLFHVFSVATKTLFMRLVFDTDVLSWKIEEIENGI